MPEKNSLDILNSIRSVAGDEYQARIPEAVRTNIASVGNTILSYQPFTNKFFTELINRIGRVIVERMDSVDDIYSVFKDERLEFGDTVQRIFVDIPTAKAFEGSSTLNPASMLSVEKGVIHVEYISVDRKLYYKRTISVAELKEAFTTVAKLDEFIRAITESMATALSYDKYIMTTETLYKACAYALNLKEQATNASKVKVLSVPSTVAQYNKTTGEIEWDTVGAKVFLKMLRVASGMMKFPHEIVYASFDASGDIEETEGLISAQKTKRSDQVLGLEVSTLASIDVDALATLFNLSKADLQTQVIEIEDGALGLVTTSDQEVEHYVGGFLCNKGAVERGTSFEDRDSFKNPEHEYVNMWQHFWGYMAVSKFKDFVPIVFPIKASAESNESEGE